DTVTVVEAAHSDLGMRYLYAGAGTPLLFTQNEANRERLSGEANPTPYVKDGIGDFVVHGVMDRIDPAQSGTKVAAHSVLDLGPHETRQVRLRLTDVDPSRLAEAYPGGDPLGRRFGNIIRKRKAEADAFYGEIIPAALPPDAANVMRQALAGMLWGKQFYAYDVTRWLGEHGYSTRSQLEGAPIRNKQWFHMVNGDVISMPDKWEYPWYAAWDLAFHTIALAMVDLDFAKAQLELMLDERYLHPNGQVPAYEWNFGDVNPPVHAWAVMRAYQTEKETEGRGDLDFLRSCFHKLTLNYTWWVNRKDPENRDVFGGGFLGLDNIGVFDRSAPLPTGGRLEQADGTAWMAFYALTMLEMAVELALHDPSYQAMASKFFEHFLWINAAMDQPGDQTHEMWDEEDGFFYDVLVLPDGSAARLKIRSLVGLLPLAACVVVDPDQARKLPELMERVAWLAAHRRPLVERIPTLSEAGIGGRRLLGLLDEDKLRRVLARMLDEDEFLSPFGIRSMSRVHGDRPFVVNAGGQEHRVDYLPAESDSGMFGGNSNWRGPIWFPVNFLLLRGLIHHYTYYGDEFTVEFPTGSGNLMNLWEVAREIAMRLCRIFLRENDRRAVYGGAEKFQSDPHWRDLILFYEYFHGDNGSGLG
ncbi:MAG: glucosidase, partial [Actinobacteria bacterium]